MRTKAGVEVVVGRTLGGVFIAASMASVAPGAAAAEFSGSVSAGAGYSDNITQAAQQEVDETMATAGFRLEYEENVPRLNAQALADIAYIDYLDDTFDNEVLGNAAANAVFGLVPERFLWAVNDRFGQIRSDAFAAPSPSNRENVNFFSTGPSVLLRMGSRNTLRVSGRYSREDYEDSELSSQAVSGELALIRQLSGATSIGLIGDSSQYRFDNTIINDDYDRHSAYVSYQVEGARTTLSADLGYTVLDFGEEDSNSTLAILRLSRKVSASSTVSLGGGIGFPDSSEVFSDSQDRLSRRDDVQPLAASSDSFQQRFAEFAWDFRRNRTSFGLSVSASEEEYEHDTQFDRRLLIGNAQLERTLGRHLSFLMSARYDQEEFDQGLTADTVRVDAGFNWVVGRNLFVDLRGLHYERTSSSATTEFEENQVWLTFGLGTGSRE